MCPCYRCELRHRACHATCKPYKAFKAEKDKIRERRLAERAGAPPIKIRREI